jgi:hypothetical protein
MQTPFPENAGFFTDQVKSGAFQHPHMRLTHLKKFIHELADWLRLCRVP